MLGSKTALRLTWLALIGAVRLAQEPDPGQASTTIVVMSPGQVFAPASMHGPLVQVSEVLLNVRVGDGEVPVAARVELIRGVTTALEAAANLAADLQPRLRAISPTAAVSFVDNTVFLTGGVSTPATILRPGASRHRPGEAYLRYMTSTP